ncbi:MAG: cold shock domain-containing protein [Parachlamydiales bacterium]|jgi:CspA family cold shock protein
MKGTVQWFSDEKGYGFISPDEGVRDLIVQRSNIQIQDQHLYEGQRVEFEQIRGPKGPEAVNVRPAN